MFGKYVCTSERDAAAQVEFLRALDLFYLLLCVLSLKFSTEKVFPIGKGRMKF